MYNMLHKILYTPINPGTRGPFLHITGAYVVSAVTSDAYNVKWEHLFLNSYFVYTYVGEYVGESKICLFTVDLQI